MSSEGVKAVRAGVRERDALLHHSVDLDRFQVKPMHHRQKAHRLLVWQICRRVLRRRRGCQRRYALLQRHALLQAQASGAIALRHDAV